MIKSQKNVQISERITILYWYDADNSERSKGH